MNWRSSGQASPERQSEWSEFDPVVIRRRAASAAVRPDRVVSTVRSSSSSAVAQNGAGLVSETEVDRDGFDLDDVPSDRTRERAAKAQFTDA